MTVIFYFPVTVPLQFQFSDSLLGNNFVSNSMVDPRRKKLHDEKLPKMPTAVTKIELREELYFSCGLGTLLRIAVLLSMLCLWYLNLSRFKMIIV